MREEAMSLSGLVRRSGTIAAARIPQNLSVLPSVIAR